MRPLVDHWTCCVVFTQVCGKKHHRSGRDDPTVMANDVLDNLVDEIM